MKVLQSLLLASLLASCSTLKSLGVSGEPLLKKDLSSIWIKNLDPKAESGNLPIGLQTPLIGDGIVYVGDNSGYFKAYELDNGKEIFSEFDGSSYHSAPVLYKGQVIYGTVQGRVISRNATSGIIKFSVDLGASVESRGVIHNGRALFHLRNHQVFCLDVETGKILWAYKRSISNLTTLQRSAEPIVYKDKVLVGFADGVFVALSIDEGVLLYETKLSNASKFVDVDNQAYVLNDKVFIGSIGSPLSMIDPVTGKILKRADFIATRSPIADLKNKNESLFVPSPNGEIILADKNLNIVNKKKISKGSITSLSMYKNKIVASTSLGEILLLNPLTFEKIEEFKLGHAYSTVFGDVVSDQNFLAVYSSRNRLYLFH